MSNCNIVVIGLGYVGLPLAIELAKNFPVTGFDINRKRIEILKTRRDPNGEVERDEVESKYGIMIVDRPVDL